MDITPLIPAGRQIIEAYGDGGFRVSGQRYEGPLLVFPHYCVGWNIDFQGEIPPAFMDQIFDIGKTHPIHILLLGTGTSIRPASKEIKALCQRFNIVIEPMDTGAACRTYNVLLAEGRNICAALLPV